MLQTDKLLFHKVKNSHHSPNKNDGNFYYRLSFQEPFFKTGLFGKKRFGEKRFGFSMEAFTM